MIREGHIVWHKDVWRNERWGIVRGNTQRGYVSVKWLAYKSYRTGEILYYKKSSFQHYLEYPIEKLTKLYSLVGLTAGMTSMVNTMKHLTY